MIYSCRKCGREFQWEEAVSFCPFCGNAYASFAVASPAPATRVVIGSDSERTVQEKYWRMSHKEIDDTIRLLGALLPTEENVQPCQFDLHEWLQQQKRCRSARQFKKNCDSFLSKIASFLQQERFGEEQAVFPGMKEAAVKIQDTGRSIARILGQETELPQMPLFLSESKFSISNSSEEPGKQNEQVFQAYLPLLRTIELVKPVLYSLLEENGMFAVLSILGSEAMKADVPYRPAELSERLQSLAQKDYDPLFGEEYDDFVQTFWKGILLLTKIINDTLYLAEFDAEQQEHLLEVQAYLTEWKQRLCMRLDHVYQNQQVDLMMIQPDLHQIYMELLKSVSEE